MLVVFAGLLGAFLDAVFDFAAGFEAAFFAVDDFLTEEEFLADVAFFALPDAFFAPEDFDPVFLRGAAFGKLRLPAAALPAMAPMTPPTTAPTGPATLPMTAPVAAPAACFEIGGMVKFSDV